MEESKMNLPDTLRALFIAPSGAGKTVLMSGFVLELIKDGYVHPKRVMIIATNYKSDPSLKKLIDECVKQVPDYMKSHCYEEIPYETLESMYKSQKQIQDKGGKLQRYLVILDDQACDVDIKKRNTQLTKFQMMGRHQRISTILLIQAYRSLVNPIIIKNANLICLGRLNSQDEIDDISRQYSAFLDVDKKKAKMKLMQWYFDAIKKNDNHGFFSIWSERALTTGKFQQGLTDKIYYDQLTGDQDSKH